MFNRARWFAVLALVAALVAIRAGSARADLIVDVTASSNLSNTSTFGSLDLTTGKFTSISVLSVTVEGLTSGPDGSLYAGASDGSLYKIGSNGTMTPFGSITAPVPPGGLQNGYFGLTYAGVNGFYAANLNPYFNGTSASAFLDHISANGNSVATIGTAGITPLGGYSSGNLAFGPNGTLYFSGYDFSTATSTLYGVDPTTGIGTAIGTGLGTSGGDALTLVNVGGQLYGIDTIEPSGSGPIGIYTINTTTGVATDTGVTVSGLASGFTLDTATAVVPEPSSLTLCALAGAAGLAYARARGRRG